MKLKNDFYRKIIRELKLRYRRYNRKIKGKLKKYTLYKLLKMRLSFSISQVFILILMLLAYIYVFYLIDQLTKNHERHYAEWRLVLQKLAIYSYDILDQRCVLRINEDCVGDKIKSIACYERS